jgi:hypothetical protein
MPTVVETQEKAKWQAESDARTLVDAEMIKGDSKRFKAVITQIKKENKARQSAVKK